MYTLDLICSNGHVFEGWFANRAAFERQHSDALIGCPSCGDVHVRQALTPVRIKRHAPERERPSPPTSQKPVSAENIRQYIQVHFEDVGARFADEAVRIHIGDSRRRNIRGTATSDEERMLTEEGIPYLRMPVFNS